MPDRKTITLLILLFVITLSFRLYFSFQYENLSPESYFHLYQSEKIKSNLLPLNYDELSYSGRIISYPPLFHYIIASTSFIPYNYRVIPALLFALSSVIAFLISLRISNSRWASLLSALLYSFTPVFIKQTLNSVSVYSLALPLMFLLIYLTIISKEKNVSKYFILVSVLLFFTHPSFLILTLTFILYPLLLKLVNIKINENRKEVIIFFIIISLLAVLFLFKQDLSQIGFNTIFQNIPDQIKHNYFRSVNIIEIISGIGLLTIIFGLIGISNGVFKSKQSSVFLISSLIISTFILLLFKLIDFNIGIMILGLSLAVLSSLGMNVFFTYVSKTKLHKSRLLFILLVLLLTLFTSVIPSIVSASNLDVFSSKEMEAFTFLKEKTSKLSTVAASPIEGHIINFVGRRNILDTYYLSAPATTERFDDLNTLFKTELFSASKKIIDKYGVDYILLTKHGKMFYSIEKLNYHDKCIKEVFQNEEARIYSTEC